VAFAGRFATVTRDEAAELAADAGGVPVTRAGDDTAMIVVGDEAWPVRDDGRIAENLELADGLRARGRAIEVIREAAFLDRLGLAGERAERPEQFTITQLSRILKLPRRRIRAWIRRGLVRPAATVHRIDYFDFVQVAELKRLAELAENGVAVETIRDSLRRLSSWFPETESALARLEELEGEGGLLVRLRGGKLAEPTGQLRLFDAPAPPADEPGAADITAGTGVAPASPPGRAPDADAPPDNIVAFPGYRVVPPAPVPSPGVTGERSADEWFEIALEHEEAERPEEAARAYREALLAGGPSAEIAFNLGNVLYSLGRWEEALSRFQQAVEVDPDYAEAWNNLSSVHAQFEEWPDAIEAGCRALELAPDFADAHYNLAEAYHASGRPSEARRHARAYLRIDPQSPWAERLRQNLALA
jgi:tetratricopeptide (TPR) repeat protein